MTLLEKSLSQALSLVSDAVTVEAGTLLNNIAVLHHELGRWDDADAFYKRSLAVWEQCVPQNHKFLAQSLSNRAALYREIEAYPEAERVFQLALRIWNATECPSPSTMKTAVEEIAITDVPLWVEQPQLSHGHMLPRFTAAVQALKRRVRSREPNAIASLHQTLEKLGPWYHNVDLGQRLSTAPSLGEYPSARWAVIRPFVPGDLTGKTVLDIGCNSGFFGFKMKKRHAARVVGIDIMPHILAQARFLSSWFDYPVELYEMSTYDVDRLHSRFDIVVFVGVLYHLKHPLYALEKVADLCEDTMYFQTVVRGGDGDFEPKDDYPITEAAIFGHPHYPKLYFIEKSFNGDESNWWFATRSCVKAMLRVAGFRKITETGNIEVFVCKKS